MVTDLLPEQVERAFPVEFGLLLDCASRRWRGGPSLRNLVADFALKTEVSMMHVGYADDRRAFRIYLIWDRRAKSDEALEAIRLGLSEQATAILQEHYPDQQPVEVTRLTDGVTFTEPVVHLPDR